MCSKSLQERVSLSSADDTFFPNQIAALHFLKDTFASIHINSKKNLLHVKLASLEELYFLLSFKFILSILVSMIEVDN